MNTSPRHPIQPLITDERGTQRFHSNAIVNHLLEVGRRNGCGLNELACMNFRREDWVQFAQLTGYSLGGFGELSYVSDEDYGAAATMAESGQTETEARIAYLEAELTALREGLVEPMARLFGKHPDDLRRG